MKDSFTINDLPLSERPRERLLAHGVQALSAQEVLALVLGRGVRGESVMITAQRLMSKFGNFRAMAEATPEELASIKGIGPAKAAQLKAAFELGKRADIPLPLASNSLRSPTDVVAEMRAKLKGKKKEHFWVVLLNTRNQVIRKAEISIGSLNASIVHPREVFKEAVTASAASVILVHNHPSGDPQPSQEDIELTRRLVQAGEMIGVSVLDHIIVCDERHSSLKGLNLM